MAKVKEKIDYKKAQEKGAELVKSKQERDAKMANYDKSVQDFKNQQKNNYASNN